MKGCVRSATRLAAAAAAQREFKRGKQLRCPLCRLTGATTGCIKANCPQSYHVQCALDYDGHVLFDRKPDSLLIACRTHASSCFRGASPSQAPPLKCPLSSAPSQAPPLSAPSQAPPLKRPLSSAPSQAPPLSAPSQAPPLKRPLSSAPSPAPPLKRTRCRAAAPAAHASRALSPL